MSSFNRFPRRGVRVVYGLGLENQRNVSYRGFESHPLRNKKRVRPAFLQSVPFSSLYNDR